MSLYLVQSFFYGIVSPIIFIFFFPSKKEKLYSFVRSKIYKYIIYMTMFDFKVVSFIKLKYVR